MSTTKTGSGSEPDDDHLRTVTQALYELVPDDGRVTLADVVGATALDPADAERAMGHIERVAPVSAKRVGGSGRQLTWEISL
ncbi:hypothetical protein ACKVMT_14105 [Halobacteriales archaeon Cl-PHB]